MLLAIYKSSKKDETYLYLPKRDDFSAVPAPLMAQFGKPQFVMLFPVKPGRTLAQADIDSVLRDINDKGFYLQLPPPKENLLKAFRQSQGLDNES